MRPPRLLASLALVVALAACGGDKKAIDASPSAADAKPTIDAVVFDAPVDAIPPDARPDAKPSTVQVLASCPGTVAATVTVAGAPGSYHYVVTFTTPSATTIAPNDVVHFIMGASIHSAVSGTPPSMPDGQFAVPLGGDECLKFTQAGMFPFYCSFHFFTAKLTVQ